MSSVLNHHSEPSRPNRLRRFSGSDQVRNLVTIANSDVYLCIHSKLEFPITCSYLSISSRFFTFFKYSISSLLRQPSKCKQPYTLLHLHFIIKLTKCYADEKFIAFDLSFPDLIFSRTKM